VRLQIPGMAKINPFQFVQQVRTEAAKVTWPTRRETAITTLMVFAMVALATLFFFAADQIMSWGVDFALSTAS
jgi:preprotein translocase subunit SecE